MDEIQCSANNGAWQSDKYEVQREQKSSRYAAEPQERSRHVRSCSPSIPVKDDAREEAAGFRLTYRPFPRSGSAQSDGAFVLCADKPSGLFHVGLFVALQAKQREHM